jgi:hypothetical protein
MTFNELVINVDYVRGFDDIFTDYLDADIHNLKRETSIQELAFDVSSSLGFQVDDTTTLNTYATAYAGQLSKALMWLQLYYFYANLTLDKESAVYIRMLDCQKKYEAIKNRFSQMVLDDGVSSKSIRIIRG